MTTSPYLSKIMESVVQRKEPDLREIDAKDILDSRTFVRDSSTWACYLLYGYWSYVWAAFGAFVPFLRTQFNIDYSTSALHFSALAVGPFISGFLGDRILSSLGLSKTMIGGMSLVLMGLFLVVAGDQLVCTICGALLVGFGGNIMSVAITTSMSNRFGRFRAIGFTENQIAGSLFTLSAPLAVSLVTKFGHDWRDALTYSVVPLAFLMALSFKSLKRLGSNSIESNAAAQQSSALSPSYWLFFTVIFFSVAAEWTVAFWSPEFLGQTFHLSKPDAAFGMSIFITAMLVGRVAGGFILRFVQESKMLAGSAMLAAIGFLIFWLARDLPINLIGLFIMGLGESNVYPLSLSRAIASVSGSPAKATARISLSTGSAILLAPLCLGMLADRIGITSSYGMVAALLILAAFAVSFADRVKRAGNH